jgi:hypothetical protein
MSGALVHQLRGVLHAPEQTLEGSVRRHVDDPHRQVDLLALGPAQRSHAVPAVGQLRQ